MALLNYLGLFSYWVTLLHIQTFQGVITILRFDLDIRKEHGSTMT